MGRDDRLLNNDAVSAARESNTQHGTSCMLDETECFVLWPFIKCSAVGTVERQK